MSTFQLIWPRAAYIAQRDRAQRAEQARRIEHRAAGQACPGCGFGGWQPGAACGACGYQLEQRRRPTAAPESAHWWDSAERARVDAEEYRQHPQHCANGSWLEYSHSAGRILGVR